MSLDIYLEFKESYQKGCEECGHPHYCMRIANVFHENLTHNLTKMAEEAKLYRWLWRPEEENVKKASELIPHLEMGLKNLLDNPSEFKKFNPENGWGTYEILVKVVQNYLYACQAYPESLVRVCR